MARSRRLSGAALVAIGLGAQGALAEEINVYSSRHYDTDVALYDNFAAETGIEVNLIEGDADQLIERIKAEGSNSPADVLITVDAGRLWRAEDAGLLARVSSEVLEERIPSSLRHPEGEWFGLSQRLRSIVYAKDRVDPSEVTTYEDLAEAKWQGRICIRSSTNVYNQSLVASMIEADGLENTEAWAEGLIDNLARPPQGGDTDQIKAVAAGECDVAVVNHYYLVRLIKSDSGEDRAVAEQVGIVFPNQDGRGAHANISGAGIVATAPNRDNAIRFLEYLTTPEAQAFFAEGNSEFPVVAGVKIDPILEQWGEIKTDQVNAAKYGENNPEAVKLMDRVAAKRSPPRARRLGHREEPPGRPRRFARRSGCGDAPGGQGGVARGAVAASAGRGDRAAAACRGRGSERTGAGRGAARRSEKPAAAGRPGPGAGARTADRVQCHGWGLMDRDHPAGASRTSELGRPAFLSSVARGLLVGCPGAGSAL
jgi:iron(III) transport system substrate-binding protein